jgi:hypothetical protein
VEAGVDRDCRGWVVVGVGGPRRWGGDILNIRGCNTAATRNLNPRR